jgi:hypothetical protein
VSRIKNPALFILSFHNFKKITAAIPLENPFGQGIVCTIGTATVVNSSCYQKNGFLGRGFDSKYRKRKWLYYNRKLTVLADFYRVPIVAPLAQTKPKQSLTGSDRIQSCHLTKSKICVSIEATPKKVCGKHRIS